MKKWINIYQDKEDGEYYTGGFLFNSKKEAEADIGDNEYIKAQEIEIEI